jgi:hypothetical protein
MGLSDVALAWTDGSSYICIAREYLSRLRLNRGGGIMSLWLTLFHELSHDEDTSDTHIHGMEFYRRYHDLTIGSDTHSPVGNALYFFEKMKQAKIDEQMDEEIARQQKAKAARDKALNVHVVAEHGDEVKVAARVAAKPRAAKPKAVVRRREDGKVKIIRKRRR